MSTAYWLLGAELTEHPGEWRTHTAPTIAMPTYLRKLAKGLAHLPGKVEIRVEPGHRVSLRHLPDERE